MFFHTLTIAGSRESFFHMRLLGQVFKHLSMDTESVNGMKETCVIVNLHILPDPIKNHSENTAKTLNYPFLHYISFQT